MLSHSVLRLLKIARVVCPAHSGHLDIASFLERIPRTGRDRAPLHSDGPKGGEYSQKKSTLLGDLIDLVRRIAGDLLRLGGGAHAGQRSVLAITAHAVGAGLEAFRHIDVAPLTRTKLSRGGGCWTLAALAPLKDER